MTERDALLVAVSKGGVDALEAAWLERLEDPPRAEVFLSALAAVPPAHRQGSASSLLTLLLETYQRREAHADALAVARALHPFRPDPAKVDVRAAARRALSGLHGREEWFPLFERLSNLERDDLADALERFERLMRMLPGAPVLHRKGWGEGVVTRLEVPEEGFHVLFRKEPGRERFMPYTTGLDVLEVLSRDDLRARLLVDLEGLREDAQQNPAELVRAVCRLHGGRATAKEMKERLVGEVIEPSAWTGWWKKAKAAAGGDPWIAVENPSRPVFVLRKKALSAEDEIQTAMEGLTTLPALLEAVRGPLGLDPEEAVRVAILERLAAALEATRARVADAEAGESAGAGAGAGLAATAARPGAVRARHGVASPGRSAAALAAGVARAEAALLLQRHARLSLEEAGAVLHEVVRDGLGFGELVAALSPANLRRDAVAAFVAAEPQLWSDAVIGDLPSLPGQVLEFVGERLVAEGRGEALANRFGIFLLTPSRQPEAVMRFSKLFANGLFEDVPGAPSLGEVVMGLLHLVETQAPKAARKDREARAAVDGVADLLLDKKRGLLKPFVQHAARPQMEAAMHVRLRCRAMPENLANALDRACHERFPDLVPRDETPFWETSNIYSTRAGLARRQEQYRVLVEEKIPENSETIGRAASYGDLSENFEWSSAIEQQRQLTEKAAAMEAELKLARTIEDQDLPEGIAAPGMRVTFEQDGADRTVTILGPWDQGEGIVSYRAPVAAGLLGSKPGDRVVLELPDGPVNVTVRSIERGV